MTHTFSYSIDNILEEIEKFDRLQRECKEQTLADIITKYDFIVGSIECKNRLMEVLPEGANIICTPYIESPTTIYAIKKFDTMDLLFEPQESEVRNVSEQVTVLSGRKRNVTIATRQSKRCQRGTHTGL